MFIDDEDQKLLMIPGPTPVRADVLASLAQPTVAHTSGALASIITGCQDGIRVAAGTREATTFIFAGSGTLAQEAAVVNVLQPGEKMLVVSNGYFGDRFAEIAGSHGIEFRCVSAPWGQSVTAAQLREELEKANYQVVTITHVDTSTGTAAPIGELAAIAREHGALTIVDCVCSLGGISVEMDRHAFDVVLTGAQKALGVPPGLAILAVSHRALERRRSIQSVSTFYADFLKWEASMSDPRVYFSTHAVNHFYALATALEIMQREGLDERIRRHEQFARSFRAGMQALGFSPFTAPECLAATLSVLAYPPGVDDERFRTALGAHGVAAAGCLGEFRGRGLRFGHMGNITGSDILRTISAVEDALHDSGISSTPGAGVSAAQSLLTSAATPA